MTGTPPLSAGIREFIENMGLYYEQYGLPRIGGRMLGLLMVSGWPLSLDDMAAALQVSRASISTNVRQTVLLGMAEQVSLPGDRRDYYRFPADAVERMLLTKNEGIIQLKRLAQRGLTALGPDGDELDRSRLEEVVELCDFIYEEMSAWPARWRVWRAAKRARRASPPTPASGESTEPGQAVDSLETPDALDTPA